MMAKLLMVNGKLPPLDNVTPCELLVVPMVSSRKRRLVEERTAVD
jgi:hypothetical protein